MTNVLDAVKRGKGMVRAERVVVHLRYPDPAKYLQQQHGDGLQAFTECGEAYTGPRRAEGKEGPRGRMMHGLHTNEN